MPSGRATSSARPVRPDEVQMLPGALTGRAAGSWTDDTDMAMAIARVAATGARLEEPAGRAAVASGFAEWYALEPTRHREPNEGRPLRRSCRRSDARSHGGCGG